MGQAYAEWLTPREQRALAGGCDVLLDFIFDEFATTEEWDPESIAESALGSALPSRYLSRYTSGFLRRFTICITTVAWKLAQPTEYPLASVAEQLAAWAIIQYAKSFLDMEREREQLLGAEGGMPTPVRLKQADTEGDKEEAKEEDLELFLMAYFDNTDFLFLFDDAYDGIDTSPAGEITGMASLAFQDWFRPFSGDPAYVTHPFTWDEE